MKKALIIGASSGLGYELARQLASQGNKVAVVSRNTQPLAELQSQFPNLVFPFAHDVRQTDAIPPLFAEICRALDGLDLVIYSAGVMPAVELNEFDTEKDTAMIEVNVTGAVAWLNEAAARFHGVGAGQIVGIGSVAGERGRAGQPVYNASKAFLHTYLEALRNRLARRGVGVITIKPGPVDTPMTAHLSLKKMPVDVAARSILKLLKKRNGEFFLSPVHAVAFAIIRAIPSVVFRKLNV